METDNFKFNGKRFLDDRRNESWDGHEANNLYLLTENVGDKEVEEEKVEAII